jgi:processive 1,2-diacylglycerol beta-glucosyltransferase
VSFIKNILIISSEFTGHGHKSITDSLIERFSKYPDVKIHVVDGFSLGGNLLVRVGKMYGTITRNAKELWKIIWEISIMKPSLINEFIGLAIEENFIKSIKHLKPDLILSVHPNFNGCIIDIMEKYNIKIPFGTLLADLVSIYPLWADPRADFIICPTEDSFNKCLEFGVDKEKLLKIGLPVRSRFCIDLENTDTSSDYTFDRPLECLIMSGGEGSGNMSMIAKILLNNFNCNISIIAGRNKAMKVRIENSLKEKYGDKVNVYGFVTNIEQLMLNSDIAFTRGSPNVMMEAVMCNTPLIITGALPGQEEGNPEYFERNNLGVICYDTSELKSTVAKLLENNAKQLNDLKRTQREFRDPMIADKIVDFLNSFDISNKYIPQFLRKKRNLTNPQELLLHTKASIRKARSKRRL